VLNNEIRGKNGSLFLFAGLKHNVHNIKVKRAWTSAGLRKPRR
jgi:hypothetical protein